MKYIKFRAEKLVRDRIPENLKKDGIDCEFKLMNQEEFLHFLKHKIVKEARELLNAKTREELVEELADTLDVIEKFSNELGVSKEEINIKRLEKIREKGEFNDKIFLNNLVVSKDHPKVKHYINKGYEIIE